MSVKELKNSVNATPPQKMLADSRASRFACIFFNLAMFCFAVMIISLLATTATTALTIATIVILFIVIVLMVIFTLGTVFLKEDKPVAKVWGIIEKLLASNDTIDVVMQVCLIIAKWASIVGLATSLIALILLIVSNGKGKTVKIVFSSIAVAATLGILIWFLVTGGAL